jgi:hypothetical protein
MAKSPSAAIAEDDSKQDANTEVPFETFETIREAKVSQWVKAFKIFGQENCLQSGKISASADGDPRSRVCAR